MVNKSFLVLSIMFFVVLVIPSQSFAACTGDMEINNFTVNWDITKGLNFKIYVDIKNNVGGAEWAIDFIDVNNPKHKLFCFNATKEKELHDVTCDLEYHATFNTTVLGKDFEGLIEFDSGWIAKQFLEEKYKDYYPEFGLWKFGEVGGGGTCYYHTEKKYNDYIIESSAIVTVKEEERKIAGKIDYNHNIPNFEIKLPACAQIDKNKLAIIRLSAPFGYIVPEDKYFVFQNGWAWNSEEGYGGLKPYKYYSFGIDPIEYKDISIYVFPDYSLCFK